MTLIELPEKKYLVMKAFSNYYEPRLKEAGYNFSRDTREIPLNWDLKTTGYGKSLAKNQISLKSAWRRCERLAYGNHFQKQLVVRDFFAQHAYKPGDTVFRQWESSPWDVVPVSEQNHRFNLWKQGQTGCDIVDACMNQLRDTGFISNRQRMLCASYLSKNLMVLWIRGEEWFRQTLNDYHEPSNLGNWIWVSGAGFNTRISDVLSPDVQATKIDPERALRAKFLPKGYDLKPYVGFGYSRDLWLKSAIPKLKQ